ncbi:MAG: response regulator transcription factor [Chloroflexi bacterium]|nr:response regulator transcription factor [Chloroflexota bacterium]
MKNPCRILIVDDEPRLVRFVKAELESMGYQVATARTGDAALRQVEANQPDLVLLDIMLPGIDGFEVCRRLRETSDIPIIMLTAKGGDEDKVKGLDLGADDYLAKPFHTGELYARVRAVLRRAQPPGAKVRQPLACGNLTIDFGKRQVKVSGKEVRLSRTEYRLLYELVTNAGRVLLHEDLLRRVWGRRYENEVSYLWIYIGYLRQKIEDNPRQPKHILTQPGVGYMFCLSTPD